MGLQDSLTRLLDRMSDHPHIYRPSILSFLQLDAKKIARELRLAERGKERGEKNAPPTDSEVFDDVENEVIELIEGEVKKAHAALHDDLFTYSQRLHALDLEGRFSTIKEAAMDGISSFRSEVSKGLNSLSARGNRLYQLEQYMRDFKVESGLKRTAFYPQTYGKVWRWGLIALLFLAEVLGNSYFLSKGSVYGLIGGFAEAVIIAFLNIGISMALGIFGIQQCWHRAFWRKLIGFLSLIGWLAFIGIFNLFVAHYREAAGAFLEGGGAVALQALKTNLIGFTDFQSWVLFGIGALFAFIALVDALSMDDLYPFYGKLDRTVEDAREEYAQECNALITELGDIKAQTTRAMRYAQDDLSKRRGEHGSILDGYERALHTYEQHLTYLERAGNTLLSIYREANCETRSDLGPKRFKEIWSVMRPPVKVGSPSSALPQEKLETEVMRTQSGLDDKMREVHDEYERSFLAYRGLDEFLGGSGAKAEITTH